jgi:predicted RNA binding protein YcfA (HicA-like mRNA interferase family)
VPGRLRALSGADVVRALSRFGFLEVKQTGSHAKLRRQGPFGEVQTLHVPLHRELRLGTLRAIFRQASEYLSPDDLRPYFYSG